MDLNLVVIAGKLAATPETRIFEGGGSIVRLLVTTRSEEPKRRIDVVPVVMWDPDPDHVVFDMVRGDRVWVAGAIQRRFWSDDNSRRSRIEVVAHHVQSSAPDGDEAYEDAVRASEFDAMQSVTVADEPVAQRAGLEGL